MTSILAATLCALAIAIGFKIWRHRLNPIITGVLVWFPPFILATIPREFISPIYSHLNHEIGLSVFGALILGFFSFSIGVLTSLLIIGYRSLRDVSINRYKVNIHEGRLLFLYILGLCIYLYAILNSGLTDVLNLDQVEVSESRYALHLGPLSFLVIFIDIGSIVFFARMFETGRYFYCIPMLVSIIFHMTTLQKSPTLFLVVSIFFLCLLYPQQSREMFIGTLLRKLLIALFVSTVAIALFIMNLLRGIGLSRFTTFESNVFEQVYIYSGATAILNLSSAIEGLVPTNPPMYGLILIRPVSWHLIDRQLLDIGFYFDGINAATYLIYPWGDFRWIGFFVTPFLTGALLVVFYKLALRKTIIGIILGAIAFKSVIFSPNTDVIFDPLTLIIIFVALMAHLFASKRVYRLNHHPL